ncbi:hypothetical protein Bra3105_14420 [Brachybacterium halotolerans subsp. kimchii]|uniref:hypothetical protein n=1 Tax=Brachybacterium halotolerans TaxID=2795215 RepID=UPI001E63657B|nr:hypothetical protein [Brachybacterium halotolerans]UEJ82028.1 hypothetical protein Bra3105_14420 [Brachybacterium halotolerans subsp. kimchii]
MTTIRNTHASTTRSSTAAHDGTRSVVTRGTFLRSAIVATGGLVGLGGLATSAQAAGTAGATPTGENGDLELPESWEDTVYFEPPPSEDKGYIASFTTLYGHTPVDLTKKELEEADGIVNFRAYGDDDGSGPTYTPSASSGISVGGDPVEILFTGNDNSELMAEAHYVLGTDPESPGILLHVLGTKHWTIRLPERTDFAWDLIQVDSPALVTQDDAEQALWNAVSMGYAEEDDGDFDTTIKHVKIVDGGDGISGWTLTNGATDPEWTLWYGTAIGGDGGWSYLFGKVRTDGALH